LHAHTRQLPPLPHRHKRRSQSERDDRADEEPARVKPDYDVDLLGRCEGVRGEVVHEVGDEGLECEGVAEDGEPVYEVYALQWVRASFSNGD
jgi:hypothetical protein